MAKDEVHAYIHDEELAREFRKYVNKYNIEVSKLIVSWIREWTKAFKEAEENGELP